MFPHYRRAPKAQYPSQIEEAYAEWIVDHGADHDLDPTRLAIAGDSCGGNMAIAVTLMATERGGPSFAVQLLYYPVTDAGMDTDSYHEFAEGYFLTAPAMAWFWDQYLPDTARRGEASHRHCVPAPTSCQVCLLPRSSTAKPTSCGRRRGIRRQTPRGRSARHRDPLRRHHPRLRDAARTRGYQRGSRCHRTRRCLPADGTAKHLTHTQ